LKSVLYTSLIAAISFILFVPFYLTFKPAVMGVMFTYPLIEPLAMLRMFGLFAVTSLPATIILYFKKDKTHDQLLHSLLFSYGIFLALVPVTFVVKDIYFIYNPEYFRANTIFKFWYQSWILLGVSSPFLFLQSLELFKNKKLIKLIYLSVVAIFTAGSLYYSYYSVKYLVGETYLNKGLEGTYYLSDERPDNTQFISWLEANTAGQPVLLASEGESYTTDSAISAYTGLPTVLGWRDHELGWRNNWPEIESRIADITTMYTSSDPVRIKELVEKYQVRYAVITEREYEKYGDAAGNGLILISNVVSSYNRSLLLEINQNSK
jgi:uncharacterized membrane protein